MGSIARELRAVSPASRPGDRRAGGWFYQSRSPGKPRNPGGRRSDLPHVVWTARSGIPGKTAVDAGAGCAIVRAALRRADRGDPRAGPRIPRRASYFADYFQIG